MQPRASSPSLLGAHRIGHPREARRERGPRIRSSSRSLWPAAVHRARSPGLLVVVVVVAGNPACAPSFAAAEALLLSKPFSPLPFLRNVVKHRCPRRCSDGSTTTADFNGARAPLLLSRGRPPPRSCGGEGVWGGRSGAAFRAKQELIGWAPAYLLTEKNTSRTSRMFLVRELMLRKILCIGRRCLCSQAATVLIPLLAGIAAGVVGGGRRAGRSHRLRCCSQTHRKSLYLWGVRQYVSLPEIKIFVHAWEQNNSSLEFFFAL